MEEIWKRVPGWSRYEASTFGRVRFWWKGVLVYLAGWINKGNHYLYVTLRQDGRQKKFRLNRLILIVFVSNPPFPKAEGMHTPDKNKLNCRADNLQWGTHKENVRAMGEQGVPGRYTYAQVAEIRRLACEGMTGAAIGRQLGRSRRAISAIISGQSWAEDGDKQCEGFMTQTSRSAVLTQRELCFT